MVLRWLFGGDSEEDADEVTVKGVYSNDENSAKDRAEKIAKKEGISGDLEIQEKPDSSGGSYYQATWRKKK